MPRFRPGLWPTVAAIVVIAATSMLGNWQHNRANYKASLQAQASAGRSQPPLELRSARDVDPSMRYRRVEAAGAYVPDLQIWLDNRTYKGTAGYYVLTPLKLSDGSHALVNRGWIAGTKLRDSVPPEGRTAIQIAQRALAPVVGGIIVYSIASSSLVSREYDELSTLFRRKFSKEK